MHTERRLRLLDVLKGVSHASMGVAAVLAMPAMGAVAATPAPQAAAGFKVARLVAAPRATTNCDDLGFLNAHLYMGCQNDTLSAGGGGMSTLVEVSLAGRITNTWSIKDKIDGLAGDPVTNKVIVTLNEDASSHLATVSPTAPTGHQITYYTYSPSPQSLSAPVALHTGGGTDHVTVDSGGHIFVTASHARQKTGTAVFGVTLTPPTNASGTGTATLSPTWLDNASAANGNTGSGTVKLGLKDVDSGAIVPRSSPRFGGDYVIDDQTALTLVFASALSPSARLTALKTPYGLDDITWASGAGGTLYVVDNGATIKGGSSIYKVTGAFTPNMVVAANDSLGDQVVRVNLTDGKLTPLVQHLTTTKGLVYLNPNGSQTQLPLNGASTAPVALHTTSSKSSGSSNTGLIVGIVVVVVLLLGGGLAMMRRRGSAA